MAKKKEEMKQNICDVCGKPYEFSLTVYIENGQKVCIHDSSTVGPNKNSPSKRRHENEIMSMEALRMAAVQKREDAMAGLNKMIPVTSYQEGKNKGQTDLLPESAIKSIEEKVAPIIKEIED